MAPQTTAGTLPGAAALWLRRAIVLVALTAAYNVIEAAVALFSAWQARSVALLGFGLDSMIEFVAAALLLWRLRVESSGADRHEVEESEHRVRRFVGATFIALAVYVSGQSLWVLWSGAAPDESRLGIGLAVASLIVMPLVAWGKLRAAAEIGSSALRAEAKETLACSYLSFALLLGLAANAIAGWWQADPLAALVMVPWLIKEGREGLSGDPCCDD